MTDSSDAQHSPKRTIKIGSQRDQPDASRLTPQPAPPAVVVDEQQVEVDEADLSGNPPGMVAEPNSSAEFLRSPEVANPPSAITPAAIPVKFPPPRRSRDTGELQREIDAALAGVELDDLLSGKSGPTKGPEPQVDQRDQATVVTLHGDHVFFALPGGYEGVAARKQFAEEPAPGATMEVIVRRFNAEDGLYELAIPGQSVTVADWSDIEEGALVEARVTAHNSGGLEVEVNSIRGFIPISQVSLYRVDDLEQFLNERFTCVVTEANPERRNLVLSRRAVLEREQAENKQQKLAALEVGQTHEGVVRSLRDFGAFVDLGGIDGLVHISKLSWDRVRHPSDVLQEGQRIQVRVESVDQQTGKIGLSYRDTIVHPWEAAKSKYTEQSVVSGTVSKITDFGAFVRLEAGVEGLVHISELAHHRVTRVDSIVKVGEAVDVKILSIDHENQRMSLSLRAVRGSMADTEKEAIDDEQPSEEEAATTQKRAPSTSQVLKGGVGGRSGGEQFGLKW